MTLKKILCVMNNESLSSAIKSSIKEEFKEKYSEIELNFADNYNSAISELKKGYDAYILNDLIPKKKGKEKQFFQGDTPMSFKLIREIYNREGTSNKIIFTSSFDEILEKANKIGIKKLYNKWFAKPPYQKDIKDLAKDLRGFLGF